MRKVHRTITIPVLIKRINRKLANKGEQVRTARSVNTELSVGKYFVQDVQTGAITYPQLNVIELGQLSGVVKRGEKVAGDDGTWFPNIEQIEQKQTPQEAARGLRVLELACAR